METIKDVGRYEGHFKDNLRDGKGTFHYANGDVYIGQWNKGKIEGMGKFESKESSYEGEWLNNKKNGKGVYKQSGGKVYEGIFKNDKKSGFGKQLFSNGKEYEG